MFNIVLLDPLCFIYEVRVFEWLLGSTLDLVQILINK